MYFPPVTVPAITSKVLGSAAAAHASGTLNSHLYPLMCSGTFSLAPLFEDNKDKDTLSSALLYRYPTFLDIRGRLGGVSDKGHL